LAASLSPVGDSLEWSAKTEMEEEKVSSDCLTFKRDTKNVMMTFHLMQSSAIFISANCIMHATLRFLVVSAERGRRSGE
jgi:hypothetical protein